MVLAGQFLQGGRRAGANCANQDVYADGLNEFAGDGGGGFRVALVIADVDLEFAAVQSVAGVGAALDTFAAGGVFHAEWEAAHDVSAIDRQRAGLVGDQADFDGIGAGETARLFGWLFGGGHIGRVGGWQDGRRLSWRGSLGWRFAAASDQGERQDHQGG